MPWSQKEFNLLLANISPNEQTRLKELYDDTVLRLTRRCPSCYNLYQTTVRELAGMCTACGGKGVIVKDVSAKGKGAGC